MSHYDMMQQPNLEGQRDFSTSGSSHHHRRRHDLFISFRGSDVRHTFLSHLRTALHREGVTSFADDDSRHLPRGQDLKDAIPRAIEQSRFSVVVLSPNYASSEWCLDELVTIMRCCTSRSSDVGSRPRHVAIPIFYGLSPEQVSGCYKEDLDRHKSRFTYERVDGWLRALAWIANITGWVVPAAGQYVNYMHVSRRTMDCMFNMPEVRLVEKIARDLRRKVQELVPVERDSSMGGRRDNLTNSNTCRRE